MLEITLLILLIFTVFFAIQKYNQIKKKTQDFPVELFNKTIKKNNPNSPTKTLHQLITLIKIVYMKEQLQQQHVLLLYIKNQKIKIEVGDNKIFFNKEVLKKYQK